MNDNSAMKMFDKITGTGMALTVIIGLVVWNVKTTSQLEIAQATQAEAFKSVSEKIEIIKENSARIHEIEKLMATTMANRFTSHDGLEMQRDVSGNTEAIIGINRRLDRIEHQLEKIEGKLE